MKQSIYRIALVGNPNSGKTSLFNVLTGLNQKVGNFPGVTVDKKSANILIDDQTPVELIDLPGTYSLYPRRADEWVAYKALMGADGDHLIDLILLVIDASNLKRNLLFCSQILDLKVPLVIALTMSDIATNRNIHIDINGLQTELGVPIVAVNPRKNKGIPQLKKVLVQISKHKYVPQINDFIPVKSLAPQAIEQVQQLIPHLSDYRTIHYLINHEHFPLDNTLQSQIENAESKHNFNPTKTQAEEIVQRYKKISTLMSKYVAEATLLDKKIFTDRLDNILLHKTWGYLILLATLFLLFQSIFSLAQYPMGLIENFFTYISGFFSKTLPKAWWSNLLINGVLAGLSGIIMFVPQIMILFGFITILEDTGYMARISFLSDKLMRKVGLNGKSVMPMISGFACAVPAIMATRNIENKKERLITLLVTPLISCSARLPVYTILISLVIPNTYYLGIFSLQGLVMMGLYMTGVIMALLVSFILKFIIHFNEKSFFILELPIYRAPRWQNVGITMVEKAKIFIKDAGKVIMIISILLWFLCSFGPNHVMTKLDNKYQTQILKNPNKAPELNLELAALKLQNSYAGILGKAIEPAILPLGYDWKIGISLITSFTAREVFVGTMATLYSVESNNDTSLRQKLQAATNEQGKKVYTLPTAISLMIFYVLAMQCMSTLAVVKRETKSWKWPVIQFIYMSSLAYLFSFLSYQILK